MKAGLGITTWRRRTGEKKAWIRDINTDISNGNKKILASESSQIR